MIHAELPERTHGRSRMIHCECQAAHVPRKVVLTGGPGAGKTAALELVRQSFCAHVVVLPEAAGIVFGGGFPRNSEASTRRAGQRAIYYVQRELESVAEAAAPALILCDRGTVDSAAYWPGPEAYWPSLGTTLEAELARYDAVIHLRTPARGDGYNHANPLRIESAAEARAIDARLAEIWAAHPRRHEVAPAVHFLEKVSRVIEIVRGMVPACCRVPGPAGGAPA
jgi:predicted ATPase